MYRPLPSSQHTRVLEIRDASHGTLVLAMNVIDLSDLLSVKELEIGDAEKEQEGTAYDALSYTWGPPVSGELEALYDSSHDVEVTVLAEGSQHKRMIGRTLFEALSQIYKTMNLEPIWVDALCINQEDLEEKETHILLMCDVYSKAQRVIVWLGPDVFNDFHHILWFHTTVLDLVHARAKEKGPLRDTRFSAGRNGSGVVVHGMNKFELPEDAMKALYRFYGTRLYFSRAWIVQEVALAIQCWALIGDRLIEFYRLPALIKYLDGLGGQSMRYEIGISVGDEVDALGTIAQQVHPWMSSASFSEFLKTDYGCSDEKSTILAALNYYIGRGVKRTTEPKDLIYCLLGLVKYVYGHSVIKPDYSATTERVFTDFTTLLLEHLPYRTILSMVADKPSHAPYVDRLPSWVPDFVTSAELHMPLEFFVSGLGKVVVDFTACRNGPGRLHVEDDKLYLFGRPCAVINKTFKMFRSMIKPHLPGNVELVLEYLEVCTMKYWPSFPEALMSTMCYGGLAIKDEYDFRQLCRRYLAQTAISLRHCGQSPQAATAQATLSAAFKLLSGTSIMPSQDDLDHAEELHNAMSILRDALAEAASRGEKDVTLTHKLNHAERLHRLFPECPWDDSTPARVRRASNGEDGDAPTASEYELWEEQNDALALFAGRSLSPIPNVSNTFFIAGEHVGRTLETTMLGDELWLLCQAKVPFVLRPVGGEYRLVGEAYVHGGMFGELERTAGEAREIVIV